MNFDVFLSTVNVHSQQKKKKPQKTFLISLCLNLMWSLSYFNSYTYSQSFFWAQLGSSQLQFSTCRVQMALHHWVAWGITQGTSVNHHSIFWNSMTRPMNIEICAITTPKEGLSFSWAPILLGCWGCRSLSRGHAWLKTKQTREKLKI